MLRKTLIALASTVAIAAVAIAPNIASARGGGGGAGFSGGGHGGGHGGLDLGTAQPSYNCTHWYWPEEGLCLLIPP
jgi:Spy/CpxP family protein refolding chaperone